MKKFIWLAAIAVMCLTNGCGLFKEKCDCPKFNYHAPDAPILPENPYT